MNRLKRLWVLTTAAILLAMPVAAQDLHAKYNKEHPLIYVDAWDLWPYVFQENGKSVGYNIDLLTLIFKELGIPYVVKLKPTKDALEDLRTGRSNLMFGTKDQYHDSYTQFYSKTVIQLFTHSVALPKNQTNPVHTLDDLAHNDVIVHTGAFSHHLMEDSGWVDNAHPYNDMDLAVQKVSSEEQGIILWNTMSLKWLIRRYKTDNLKLEPVDMPSGKYHFMSNDPELLKAIDGAYDKLAAEGKLTPLQNKWFYPERQETTGIPKWVWYIILGCAVLGLLLLAYTILLRIRESKATKEGNIRNTRLSKILKTSNVGLWTYNVQTKQTYLYHEDGSPGRPFSNETFRKRYREGDYERLVDAIKQVINMQATNAHVEVCVADSKEDIVYDVAISVLRQKHGRPAVLIGTRRNVTQIRRKQEQVALIHSRYQAVFNNATVDMVYYDSSGYILSMNARAQRTFKMTEEEARNKHISLRQSTGIADLDFTQRDYFYATLLLDWNDEQHPDGIMYYELQLVPIYDSSHNLQGIYGTGHDVTPAVEAYHNMCNGLERLRQATKEVEEYITNMNYAMKIGGVRIMHYSPDTHEVKIFSEIDELQYNLTQEHCLALVAPSSEATLRHLMKDMDRHFDRQMNGEIETIVPLKGGKKLYLQVLLSPMYDAEGRVIQYGGLCRDVSDIKYTEQLLQRETARAREIEDIKNSFLHNMCYEIRTPLSTVVGFAELFDQDHSLEDEDVFIKEIKDSSKYLLRLINDILFLSRLDAHMIEITPQPCDFACTFEAHCHNGWTNKMKEGVKYVAENPYNQLVVDIDDSNLGRVIEQLVSNAAEHTTEGTVHTRYEYIGGKLIITVSDTGSGIPERMLGTIYERFGHNRNGGTGLGLPICKELITQLGGTIEISSEVDKGTSVWVTLPCQATVVDRKKTI